MPIKKALQIFSVMFILILGVATTGVTAQGGSGTISGMVTAEAGGAPLQDIDVDAYILNGSAWEFVDFGFTDSNGQYQISNLPAGTYRLLFHDLENGVYQREYYDDAPGLLSATNIVLNAGGSVNNINAALSLPQAPANDNRTAATVISETPFLDEQNVQAATLDGSDPFPSCGPKDGSVWYKITSSQNQVLRATTLGSEYDTVLAVWQQDGASLSEVACNDDVGDDLYSALDVAVSGGQTYFISVSSWGDHSFLRLSVDLLPQNFVTHNIFLNTGWNMISSYVDPWNSDVESLMAGVVQDMVIMKDGNGQLYWPSLELNEIGDWNLRNGYQVFMAGPATLEINGTAVDVGQTPLTLPAGWHTIAYLLADSTPVEQALGSINNQLLLAKDGDGRVYWPDFNVNQIGNMQPGQGYQLYMEVGGTLTYPDS